MEIVIKDLSPQVLSEFKEKCQKALEECGDLGEQIAADLARFDTGALSGSCTHQITGDNEVSIGTSSPYAIYNEMGTGIYAGGRPTPWAFQDAAGNWHRTNGMPPAPFVKPAVAEHVGEYQQIIESTLRG